MHFHPHIASAEPRFSSLYNLHYLHPVYLHCSSPMPHYPTVCYTGNQQDVHSTIQILHACGCVFVAKKKKKTTMDPSVKQLLKTFCLTAVLHHVYVAIRVSP